MASQTAEVTLPLPASKDPDALSGRNVSTDIKEAAVAATEALKTEAVSPSTGDRACNKVTMLVTGHSPGETKIDDALETVNAALKRLELAGYGSPKPMEADKPTWKESVKELGHKAIDQVEVLGAAAKDKAKETFAKVHHDAKQMNHAMTDPHYELRAEPSTAQKLDRTHEELPAAPAAENERLLAAQELYKDVQQSSSLSSTSPFSSSSTSSSESGARTWTESLLDVGSKALATAAHVGALAKDKVTELAGAAATHSVTSSSDTTVTEQGQREPKIDEMRMKAGLSDKTTEAKTDSFIGKDDLLDADRSANTEAFAAMSHSGPSGMSTINDSVDSAPFATIPAPTYSFNLDETRISMPEKPIQTDLQGPMSSSDSSMLKADTYQQMEPLTGAKIRDTTQGAMNV